MTVDQLIELLRVLVSDEPLNGDLEIVSEGCDCYGNVTGLKIERERTETFVLITRH